MPRPRGEWTNIARTRLLEQHHGTVAANGCDQPCPHGTFYHLLHRGRAA